MPSARHAALVSSLRLCGRRVDLGYSAKAVGFGVMRTRDKRPAHLCAVPTGYDTEPKRFFRFDVTRRKVLHGFFLPLSARSNAGPSSGISITHISTLIWEPGKVRKDGCHQIAMVGIVRGQAGGVEIENVTRLGGRLRPRSGRN